MDSLSFIPLGGIGDVTKNMYLYEYKNEILIVDCGIGFPHGAMPGVNLLLPDVSYLINTKKRIVGMVLTHGHEDHIGGLPFILPQIGKDFPIYATPLTAAFANEKLREFGTKIKVNVVDFGSNGVNLGSFKADFIRVTHSVPDTSHIFITTPVGNFYHGSDFKFDDTPYDGNKTDYEKIQRLAGRGVMCLMSDCLGAERPTKSVSEYGLLDNFQKEIENCQGKFFVTTYSSNVARINQVIYASESVGRKICFVGRSLISSTEVSKKLGYLTMKQGTQIETEEIKRYPDNKLTLIVAGAQGQENSAMVRIANGESKDVKIKEKDTIVFSSDPIPGNEIAVYELIDTLSKRGAKVLYSDLPPKFRVSGHGSAEELATLLDLVKPKRMIPIGGNFRHMVAYSRMAERKGYQKSQTLLLDDGQEVIFSKENIKMGRVIPVKNIYVDEVSGEEVESFVLRDRQKLQEGGIVIAICEIDSSNSQLIESPNLIVRGFPFGNKKKIIESISYDLKGILGSKKGRVTNWTYVRNLVEEVVAKGIYKKLRRRPLVIPVVMEV